MPAHALWQEFLTKLLSNCHYATALSYKGKRIFRKYYNDIITDYNKLVKRFPSNLVAKLSHYKTKTYFDGKNMEDEDTKDFKL